MAAKTKRLYIHVHTNKKSLWSSEKSHKLGDALAADYQQNDHSRLQTTKNCGQQRAYLFSHLANFCSQVVFTHRYKNISYYII